MESLGKKITQKINGQTKKQEDVIASSSQYTGKYEALGVKPRSTKVLKPKLETASALERAANNATRDQESYETSPIDPRYGKIISPEEYDQYAYSPDEIKAMEEAGEITLTEDLNKFDIFDTPESHDNQFDDQHLDKSHEVVTPKKNEVLSRFAKHLRESEPKYKEESHSGKRPPKNWWDSLFGKFLSKKKQTIDNNKINEFLDAQNESLSESEKDQ